MPVQLFDQTLLVVYFIYGLAFFGMGLTLALESGLSLISTETRALRPLAAFGILHGAHEWFESYLLQAESAGTQLPGWLPWLKVTLLAASFFLLFLYGIRTFRLPGYHPLIGMRIGFTVIVIYVLSILISSAFVDYSGQFSWVDFLDAMSRYLLAVPGAALATLALRFNASQAEEQANRKLATALYVSAVGFGVYGFTQLLVHPIAMFPADYLNTDTFRSTAGFPIQLVRALMAIVVTLGLLRATQEIRRAHNRQLAAAQEERLQALEQVQVELSKREQLRRELLRHTVQAQEEERARIARELHDETSQVLSALSLDLATLHMSQAGHPDNQKIVERLQGLSREMSQGLYRLVHDLRPAQLDDLGLVAALQYLQDECRSNGLRVHLKVNGIQAAIDPIVETVLFRVAQEALSNTLRHAGTDEAFMDLSYETGRAVLQVYDRGCGFDSGEEFYPPRGWGLAGMRERVEAVDGRLQIDSTPGQGTLVAAVIPLFHGPRADEGEGG
jgi:signal transduction histidine kinase